MGCEVAGCEKLFASVGRFRQSSALKPADDTQRRRLPHVPGPRSSGHMRVEKLALRRQENQQESLLFEKVNTSGDNEGVKEDVGSGRFGGGLAEQTGLISLHGGGVEVRRQSLSSG